VSCGNVVWEQRKLGEVAQFNPVSDLPSEFEYVDLESVVGTEMIGHRHETRESAPSRAQRLARTGDIFYQAVRPYQKNNYLYEKPGEDYVFSTGYVQMRPSVNGSFLFSTLQRGSFVDEVLNHCTGTSYPAINSSDLANIVVSIPSDEREQALIGNAIRMLDNLITLHQRNFPLTYCGIPILLIPSLRRESP
jgi:type I restriction enzyme S subunit